MKKNLVFISQDTAFPDSKNRHVLVKHRRGGWYLHPLVKHVNPAKRRKGGYPLDPRGYYYDEGKWEIAPEQPLQISEELVMMRVAGVEHRFVPDFTNEHACVPSTLVDEFLASVCCSGQAPVHDKNVAARGELSHAALEARGQLNMFPGAVAAPGRTASRDGE